MYRDAMEKLKEWKESKDRKPLVLRGARQVGKTWLLTEFGKTYQNVAYINMDRNTAMNSLFDMDMDIPRIIRGLETYLEIDIVPGETLIIFDEIQENPNALASLKYFYENAPEYHVAVAGSLLGVALHRDTSFPVGKVDFLEILPMNFYEFLVALGKSSLAQLVRTGSFDEIAPFHENLNDLLRQYLVVGGMPEAVKKYSEGGTMLEVRTIQSAILTAYENDISKHSPANTVNKIREILNILPSQLAKENKKFIFKMLREGARAKDYEEALIWLVDAGIVYRVPKVETLRTPLKFYENHDAFKLYMLDMGLLSAMIGLRPAVIIENEDVMMEYKGALMEQTVYQEMRASGISAYYYRNESSRVELDFVLDADFGVLPVEVKSGASLEAKSFATTMKKIDIEKGIKISMLPAVDNADILNLPIYLAGRIIDELIS